MKSILKLTKHSLLEQLKERWRRISAFEEDELRHLSLEQKFSQLASLLRIGLGLQLDFGEDSEKFKVRSRWVRLKKNR